MGGGKVLANIAEVRYQNGADLSAIQAINFVAILDILSQPKCYGTVTARRQHSFGPRPLLVVS